MTAGREAWAVVDLGFGDAGKGTIVDFLARERGASLVVRFNGGAQAGHSVVTGDGRHHTFSQLGAASFVPGVGTHLGPAFVFHPGALLVEARHLAAQQVPEPLARLTVDARARVITPFQQAAGRLRELARGSAAHGTCGVGVGEAVADALDGRDDVLTAADLRDLRGARARLVAQQERKRDELAEAQGLEDPRAVAEWAVLDDPALADRVLAAWAPLADVRILDPSAAERRIHAADRILFEGAQGVLLDETWGFHPHTTWSDCTFAGAEALLAGDDRPLRRLGVLRAYATRHGSGPFPTASPEFDRALPEPRLDPKSWQGAFRTGPLDTVLLRYALAVCGGVDGLALTCLDRIASWPVVPLCHTYETDHHGPVSNLDPGPAADLSHRERLGRWLGQVRPVIDNVAPSDLAREVERCLGAPVWIVGEGPAAGDKRWGSVLPPG
ncbi:MAG TPA: adenylosuccinate synthetase [Thermoanaerobaculia bacterium]|nr:adenylosuccinate synthetase [Thermoanaerobaculia bacterium]